MSEPACNPFSAREHSRSPKPFRAHQQELARIDLQLPFEQGIAVPADIADHSSRKRTLKLVVERDDAVSTRAEYREPARDIRSRIHRCSFARGNELFRELCQI